MLEFQVTEISEDVTDLQGDVLLLEGDQNILDDKILQLEIDSNGELYSISTLLFLFIFKSPVQSSVSGSGS